MSWEDEAKAKRAAALAEMAWAGGDAALQRGWWSYVAAELDKLGEGFKAAALENLKQRRAA
jgi:hypothetical protein